MDSDITKADLAKAQKLSLDFKFPTHVPSPLDPGVYFGLDEARYHDDPALGSGDMKELAIQPENFWFGSKFNTEWQPTDKEKPSFIFGRAAHIAVLEGLDSFRKKYGGRWENGATLKGKAEKEKIVSAGKIPLKGDDFVTIQRIAVAAHKDSNYAKTFEDVADFEVSIFWIDPAGIRKKARIDILKERANIDFKTVENAMHEYFPEVCARVFARYRYDGQFVHYAHGRAHLARYIKEGRIFGTPRDPDALERAGAFKGFASAFVYSQKGDKAPLVHGMQFSPGNPTYKLAQDEIITPADENWVRFILHFGLDTPWLISQPIREYMPEDFPNWYGRRMRDA